MGDRWHGVLRDEGSEAQEDNSSRPRGGQRCHGEERREDLEGVQLPSSSRRNSVLHHGDREKDLLWRRKTADGGRGSRGMDSRLG